jgi:hypothetical protein
VLAVALVGCTESLPRGGTFHPAVPEEAGRPVSMVWPAAGTIASPYRPPSRPDHRGIDLAGPPGSTVVAARAGEVGFVGKISGYGNVVAIDHGDGLATVYSHLGDEIRAVQGVRVAAGEPIGQIGPEGYLHFEIRRNKEPVDPAGYFPTPPPSPVGAAAASLDVVREPTERVPLEAGEPSRGQLEVAALPSAPAPVPAEPASRLPSAGPSSPQTTIAAAAPIPAEPSLAPAPAAGSSPSLLVGLAVANSFYVPAKVAYVAAGTVVGGLAYALTGGAVPDVLEEAYGGDWVVGARHLRGEAPLRFKGEAARR